MKVKKCWHHVSYTDFISLFATSKCQKNQKMMIDIVNIDEETLHIFRTNWGISMKFSGKMCLMIISKVKKPQGFILSRKCSFGKTSWSNWAPSHFSVKHATIERSHTTDQKRWLRSKRSNCAHSLLFYVYVLK